MLDIDKLIHSDYENEADKISFRRAARFGESETVSRYILEGIPVNGFCRQGQTALHYAAFEGNLEIVRNLLSSGADVNAVCNLGETALHRASFNGHHNVAAHLLEFTSLVNARCRRGQTALHRATYNGHLLVVLVLIENGADVSIPCKDGQNALHIASASGHAEIVGKLLMKGANVHVTCLQGKNALHRACSGGCLEAVRTICEHNANINTGCNLFWSPLHYAASCGYEEIVKELLKRGANIQSRNSIGESAVHKAVEVGNNDVLKELIANGGVINDTCFNGGSALHKAVGNGHTETVILLLHMGADANKQDKSGNTALHIATRKKYLQIATILWKSGADPLKKNNLFQSPRSFLKQKAKKLYSEMYESVKKPRLPKMSKRNVSKVHPNTPLQDALFSISQDPTKASEFCMKLISKENCRRSLTEWFAAHCILVLSVSDGRIDSEHLDQNHLYFWRDQLYCVISDIEITNEEDKQTVFKCLRRARALKLIDTVDPYIQGIHIMDSVRVETSVLKKANRKVLEYVMSVEFSIDKLRNSFSAYRQQHLYCYLLGIAFSLIPIAGGAAANALMVSAEVIGDLSGADIIEYGLSAASTLLEEENFSFLPSGDKEQLGEVFDEYGFTRQELRSLMAQGHL